MNKLSWLILLFLVSTDLILIRSVSLSSEPPPKYIIDQYYRAGTRTIETVIKKIRRNLPLDERRMLRKINIFIDRNDWDIVGVYAKKSGSSREIGISMGFLIAMDFIDTAIVAGQLGKIDDDIVMKYILETIGTILENVYRARRGEPRHPEPIFYKWIGWSESKWNALIATKEFTAYKDVIKLESFAFILGHELAHHFFGHLENRKSSVEEEDEADREGARMALKAGYNPILAFQPFILFAALEGDQPVDEATRTHPPPLCRGKYLLNIGVQNALQNEEFTTYMKERGIFYDWEENIEKMDEVFEELIPECL